MPGSELKLDAVTDQVVLTDEDGAPPAASTPASPDPCPGCGRERNPEDGHRRTWSSWEHLRRPVSELP